MKSPKEKAKAKAKEESRKIRSLNCDDYNEEIADQILEHISISTDSLRKICASNPDYPKSATINKWRLKLPHFAERFNNAKRIQAELLVEEIIEIADFTALDTTINEKGIEVFNKEWVARSRLKIDTRKWIASKLIPKIYGTFMLEEANDNLQKLRDEMQKIRESARECMQPV